MPVPQTHTQSQLSLVYLNAIATVAGFTVHSKADGGDFGIDCDISLVVEYEGFVNDAGVVLAIQLKATKNFVKQDKGISFRLKREAYTRLKAPCLQKKVLVLLTMPKNQAHWVRCLNDSMQLERSAYFIRAEDLPTFGAQQKSMTITIPEANLLTPKSLKKLAKHGLDTLELAI